MMILARKNRPEAVGLRRFRSALVQQCAMLYGGRCILRNDRCRAAYRACGWDTGSPPNGINHPGNDEEQPQQNLDQGAALVVPVGDGIGTTSHAVHVVGIRVSAFSIAGAQFGKDEEGNAREKGVS